MNTFLVLVALAAVAVAIGSALLAARVIREDRLREAARAAILVQMADDATAPEPARTIHLSVVEPDPAADEVTGVSALFEETPRGSPWPRRAAIIGGLAVVGFIGVLALRPSARHDANTAAATRGAAPVLELMSLRHTQEPDRLTVTGLVQNPRGGATLSRITATAFLFASDGTFLASGRAPLDFTTLGPGDESAFVIPVPVAGAVARYRVSFRDENGRIVAHVDRRNGAPVARNE